MTDQLSLLREFVGRGQRAQKAVDEILAEGPNVRKPSFEGPREENEPARVRRLTGQILDVFNCVKDGKKWTLMDIEIVTAHPQASISAQLRHLRKKRFGGFVVEKEHVGDGLYYYWLPLVDGKPKRRE
jgi:hypothetical protein